MDDFGRILMTRLALGITASTVLSAHAHAHHTLLDAIPTANPMPPPAGTHGADGVASSGDPVARDPALRADLQARMERHRRELLPEYEHRLAVGGRASADAWLRRQANARGRREAEAMRHRRALR